MSAVIQKMGKTEEEKRGRGEEEKTAALDAFYTPPAAPFPVVVRSYAPADYPTVLRLWEAGNLKPFTPVEIERLMGAGGNALVAVRQNALVAVRQNASEQEASGTAPDEGVLDEEVLGVILWSHNGSIGILWRLAVDPNARGLGIATRLLDRAEQEIRELGLAGVSLLTRQANEIARGMYARRGYKWSDHLEYWAKRLPDPEEKPAG